MGCSSCGKNKKRKINVKVSIATKRLIKERLIKEREKN